MQDFKINQKVLINGNRIGFIVGSGSLINDNKEIVPQVLVDLDPCNVGAGISVKDVVGETYIKIMVCHPDSLISWNEVERQEIEKAVKTILE